MKTLQSILTDPAVRQNVVTDCVQVIDAEVDSKGGLTGLAIKGAYAVVKAVKPGFITEAVNDMLPDFAARLDPLYQAARAGNQPIPAYFDSRAGEAADALLGITDDRAQRAKNPTVKKAYEKLRPTGKKHTEAAIPRVSRLIEKYAAKAE
jgi:hypothetical protein